MIPSLDSSVCKGDFDELVVLVLLGVVVPVVAEVAAVVGVGVGVTVPAGVRVPRFRPASPAI